MSRFQALLLVLSVGWTVVRANPEGVVRDSPTGQISILPASAPHVVLDARDQTSTPWPSSPTTQTTSFNLTLAGPYALQTGPSVATPTVPSSRPTYSNGPLVLTTNGAIAIPTLPSFYTTDSTPTTPFSPSAPSSQQQRPVTPTPYVISEKTLIPGAPATVLGGTTYSVAPLGQVVYVNGVPTSQQLEASTPVGTSGSGHAILGSDGPVPETLGGSGGDGGATSRLADSSRGSMPSPSSSSSSSSSSTSNSGSGSGSDAGSGSDTDSNSDSDPSRHSAVQSSVLDSTSNPSSAPASSYVSPWTCLLLMAASILLTR